METTGVGNRDTISASAPVSGRWRRSQQGRGGRTSEGAQRRRRICGASHSVTVLEVSGLGVGGGGVGT